jgi:hypothetical protein
MPTLEGIEGIRKIELQIRGIPVLELNPRTRGDIKFDLAVKFWIIAENLTEDVSEIFHVEIRDSFDTIICTKFKTI